MATFGSGINIESTGAVSRSYTDGAGTNTVTVPANKYFTISSINTSGGGSVNAQFGLIQYSVQNGMVCGPGTILRATVDSSGSPTFASILYAVFSNA